MEGPLDGWRFERVRSNVAVNGDSSNARQLRVNVRLPRCEVATTSCSSIAPRPGRTREAGYGTHLLLADVAR